MEAPPSSRKRKFDHSDTKQKKKSPWNFDVDYNDHFETPVIAYSDLLPILKETASSLNKKLSDLIIYDPYWCQGSMVQHLNSLGLSNVINLNRDFYKDIRENKVPEYDILVTNPPYSGEHKPRLMEYLKTVRKPFALLLPVYTATKSYWRQFAGEASDVGDPRERAPQSSITATTSTGLGKMFYLIPPDSYEYFHPEGTGKDIPPFFSAWFFGGFDPLAVARIKAVYRNPISCRIPVTSIALEPPTATTGTCSGSVRRCSILSSLNELVARRYVTSKRPNPKARKKLKKLMQS